MSSQTWLTGMASVVGVCVTLACTSRPNTEENVRKALEQADMEEVEVTVDETGNTVHLSGTVENLSDRTRAGELAAAAVGTSGRVLNELTVTDLAEDAPDTPDAQLTDRLDLLIDNDPVLRERDVNFEVANGVVRVKGEVRSADEKERVTKIVRNAPGVTEVVNVLEINREH
jgi:osmotically-inducible protein OsmY